MKKNIRKIKQELRNFSLSDFAMRRRRLNRGNRNFSEDDDEKATIKDLLRAVIDYDSDEIERLIKEEGVDPDEEDFEGYSPIGMAIEMGSEELLRDLVKLGADINARDFVLYALQFCRCDDDEDANVYMADEVMMNGGKPTGAALYYAIAYNIDNLEEAVDMLTSVGCDVNYAISDGDTTLKEAIEKGNVHILERILEAGAKIGPDDIKLAKEKGNKKIVSLLTKTQKSGYSYEGKDLDKELIRVASSSGNPEAIRKLLKAGANPNARSDGSTGSTALLWTVVRNKDEATKLLLEAGADPNLSEGGGILSDKTPLLDAIYGNRSDIVKLLIEYGADVNQINADDETPLKKAASHRYEDANITPEITEILLEAGADPNIVGKDKDAWSPLCCAAFSGALEVAKLLVEAGADITYECNYGTPLEMAEKYNHPKVASFLRKCEQEQGTRGSRRPRRRR